MEAALKAIAEPHRRKILRLVRSTEHTAGEISRHFDVSRPAISQHLRILKRAHLVVDRPAGNRRLYELNPRGVEALRAYFDRFWDHALESFKRAAEAKEDR